MKTRPVGQRIRIEQEKESKKQSGMELRSSASVFYEMSRGSFFKLNRYSKHHPKRLLQKIDMIPANHQQE
ncbi:hypothetical protein C8N47_101277 [Mangrovibacterium marinum]|uniref:Uncharacterized protein n=1 Tax=Mangrovibacterium marinum TaxID=1639118 RepID=A0A2T5C6P8_9BACT|nr:hypothetical protein C8N47_101277 [Mangrovibacterium marinum]